MSSARRAGRADRSAEHDHLIRTAKTIADGIGAMFGRNCEIAVHDLRDPTRSLVHLVNGHISGRQLGHPIRDLIYAVLPNIGPSDVLANYPTDLPDGRVLKSTTCLLRDSAGEPLVALCMNLDISSMAAAKETLEQLTAMTELDTRPGEPSPELGTAAVVDILRVLVRNTAKQFSRPPHRLTKDERLQAIAFLDSKGAFLIKGAVPLVAETFGVSEPSVYRYLDQVRAARQSES
ncbi:MAG TPA: PAS domain-containing protein [Pseudonocardia sp.]|uniref:helix-turn-helix transcriptional regulator n=1 Tax=Pseudonocardia sp. TaxID=60912 RepID=UPI002B4B1B1A|nr:PAS domain-containing protein [Pseudonocardia sp.]HLU54772.1 PAS domain-containing protein [Pseudonocardia sp.]